ncbi:nucleotidyltransferase family protein [Clostridium botulinum]|uniref:Nucleotidyl transferase n=1 Tax=Clostridium botulinum TaxID=1491 RepID=A0A9Q1ZEA0_CLOBO|nr:nucleotidyltransferase family protein [Clostridium botulinum]AEB75787.1 nucleotidyl transferase [Clostridium botulinum BKT015925]KEH98579.1 nucleotidyl transferase [Clostridium botulinum D str. 16868]KEI05757.1 nucleotidyl transferase [Clostridium botulinum C/D str. Sp77]KLU75624.1 nucleotidyl transferase [Clostridium botulinum V891]KOA75303.1 nucleotidyl transferase [Clostridium botulinum]
MINIKNISINYKETLLKALDVIDKAAKGIVYVVDDNMKLLGSITDGDIRRALINKLSLQSGIIEVMNKNPIRVEENVDRIEQKKIMIKNAIRELPIVDKDNKLVDTISLNEVIVPKKKKNYVLIMAGGLGTRLKDLTKEIPKPMLNLGEKPILQHIIENFKTHAYNKFLLSVNYKSEVIENYFEDGSRYECTIDYLREKKRLGTGGAINLARGYIKDDFFVVNGDVYSTVNFDKVMKFHKDNYNDITIMSIKKTINIPYGVINLEENNVKNIHEKPSYEYVISGGMYCLSPSVIDMIPQNKYYEITELFQAALKKGLKVQSYIVDDYWMDIGRIEDYYAINNELFSKSNSNEI